ncbi:unnamed protein product [Rotaria magnacalcarata]|uniref:Uncharacterized protein n=1 Tax=Rotaria magnacalcarata TaxID=392030 RepID=A0A819VLG9_9BILA|nr:unnamed protein product [Rotaria magnacalcarata]CAF2232275.1 unnamed protein product [Rotaria magnacalcarata]CAF3758351.1 unnamed protein product [Rotaria magnacalcarata]CAF3818333.1 unnamed protein product [Rotaria magnacalcarata]CAF3842587.1 unnamed protein product [Rotaria magnacalcarata]
MRSLSNPDECTIISAESELLKGGCHFNVLKLSLTYSKDDNRLPKSIIVKNLKWGKKLTEKIGLYCKQMLNVNDRETMYLKSYEIETGFYKTFSQYVQGLKVPKVYYIYENVFQNEFKLVMEDLSYCDNGQKFGFSLKKSRICLKQLAMFHAANWMNPAKNVGGKFWDIGGYWTGTKREGPNYYPFLKGAGHVFIERKHALYIEKI